MILENLENWWVCIIEGCCKRKDNKYNFNVYDNYRFEIN